MHAFMLWQAFLQNVNPLSKLIHAPLVQDQVVEASRDFNAMPRDSIALLFAIYAAAVMSWKEDECRSKMGEPRRTLHSRYLAATQQALIAAGFIQSVSLVVLQAFAVFLVSCAPLSNCLRNERSSLSSSQHVHVLTPKPYGFSQEWLFGWARD